LAKPRLNGAWSEHRWEWKYTPKTTLGRLLGWVLIAWAPTLACADTFKMNCQVEGVIEQLEGKKIPPAKVTVEIGSIGKNVFMNLDGPKPYDMRISSLVTDKFQGKNLTNDVHLGVSSRSVQTGESFEITISRDKVFLTAFKDMVQGGQLNRLSFQGPCQLPR
jgi:hypothetical protein